MRSAYREKRLEAALDRLLDGGVLPFQPNYVRRFYMDGGRLGLIEGGRLSFTEGVELTDRGGRGATPRVGGTYLRRVRLWRPERWIASVVPAANPFPIPDEGLSLLDLGTREARGRLTFRRAVELRGEQILGLQRWRAFGADFPVLIKILDPAEPIVLHFHARDQDVRAHPRRFPGHRLGKDEAYYFLAAPPGPVPYTHVGLTPGTDRRALADAIEAGRALDLSPVIHQRTGEGFFVPAGVPHRPGTALTLEIQQPSDVYTLLERRSGGRTLSPEQMHPGFASLDQALDLIDFAAATAPDLLRRHCLVPEPVDGPQRRRAHADAGTGGVIRAPGEEQWIFPPRLRKFSGKRLIVRRRFESREDGPYALLVWRGRGRLLGQTLRPGTELLITADAATRPHLFEASEPLEVFKLFPPAPDFWRRETDAVDRSPTQTRGDNRIKGGMRRP